ncbi:unnamed protein product [Pieris brassicae]|uniref:FP protein C-terminal domain-containing protein n=1 Tax=Pieris brassicae TaxID=7116 RepID=A0A9P0XHD3_PIEBR|nr:unnamed protein product [Pieris brassicae]CAH4034539.1 unnamed protein product [Pieris brassicae]
MSRIPRTPPSKNSLSGSRSESDLSTTASASNSGESNVTTRNKRPRMNSSPKGPSSSGFPSGDLRTDLLNMLSDWKGDQDRRLDEWKISLDDTLSKLVTEVTQLKKECQEIKNTNRDIENGMKFMNEQHEELSSKVKNLEGQKKANSEAINNLETKIQGLQFLSRVATIEVRNIPHYDSENFESLLSILTRIGKELDLTIDSKELRDIYRLPGKPGTARPIVAEFSCVHTRNELLSRVRKLIKEKLIPEKLNTQTLGLPGAKSLIYIDEHLPPAQRKLMYETRQIAKKFKYACWYSNGRVFLRMDAAGKPVIIDSEKCLDDLVKQII